MPPPAIDTTNDLASLQLIPRLIRSASSIKEPVDTKAPPLTPVVVEPLRWSTASFSLSFLSNIERLAISETVERNGVTHYVVQVYQFHSNSRLPTNMNNPRLAVPRLSDVGEQPCEPDFRVERRYSDFAKLRHQVKLWTCPNAHFACPYCHEYNRYIRFKLRQPRRLAAFCTSVKTRQEILQEFMTDFVDLAQNSSKNTLRRCEAHHHVPALLESFLRD
uniref:PX domain-containing protein n=1 Tax=Hyaloperonospora arabidopsidis (strain Emoy2) TaxID=559515 RepID=M4B5I3_HYAAE